MKTVSAALATLLATDNRFTIADCYTITLADSTVLNYTTYDLPLAYGINDWAAGGPVFTRDRIRSVIGLEVDTLTVYISPKDSDSIGAQTWLQAVCSGRLDGAIVELDRAFISGGPDTVVGTVSLFVGNVAQLHINRSVIEMTVNSPLEFLNVQMPRNPYQAGCSHTLFDGGCALSRAGLGVAGTVVGSASLTGFDAGLIQPDGWFDLGVLQFSSGSLTGTKRTVKRQQTGAVALLNPLPMVPAVGDNFTIWPGCDKTKATCQSKFNNLANFRGFPFVPVPETAL